LIRRIPDVVYAAAYQRRRHVFTLIDGGPESAIYKSTDAGVTWNKLKSGLPTVDMGGLGWRYRRLIRMWCMPRSRRRIWQGWNFPIRMIGARPGSGKKRIRCGGDVLRAGDCRSEECLDRIFVMNVSLRESLDRREDFAYKVEETNHHGDNHAIWIDPDA